MHYYNLFPNSFSHSTSFDITFDTDVITFNETKEIRRIKRAEHMSTFNIVFGQRDVLLIDTVRNFFMSCKGRAHSFNFKNISDFKSKSPFDVISATDVSLGLGDGVNRSFNIVKKYGTFSKRIYQVDKNTLLVSIDNVIINSLNYSVDDKGTITFNVPVALNSEVKCGYEYFTPVRFDTDTLSVIFSGYEVRELPQFELVEVELENEYTFTSF